MAQPQRESPQPGQSASRGLPTPATPTSPHSWKSIFRVGSSNALKKHSSGLTLDIEPPKQPTESPGQASTPTFELRLDSYPGSANGPMTPASTGNRDSYNSSLSIESLGQQLPPTITASSAAAQQQTAKPTSSDTGTQSKYSTLLGRSRSKMGLALQTQTSPAQPDAGSASSNNGSGSSSGRAPLSPLSPKAVGRLIRRVASAPNAKGLFSSSASRSSTPTTKNGLLATPSADVPPVPELTDGSRTASEKGDSLETDASLGSTFGRAFGRSFSTDKLRAKRSQDRLTAPNPQPQAGPAPGRAVFRRTYSSNSIKVKQVRAVALFLPRFAC